uniref:Uncharacterized protein n=1 Tax=Anguilla anguilla TaxID=7936 RepID=A0A0E9PN57_ANGAN
MSEECQTRTHILYMKVLTVRRFFFLVYFCFFCFFSIRLFSLRNPNTGSSDCK